MAKTIVQLPSGLVVGRVGLGFRGGVPGSVRQEVHDGDTINVRALGNFGVRFLGVDAPEISLPLPGEKGFRSLSDPLWEKFLENPFAETYPPFQPPLAAALRDHLEAEAGPGAAINQYGHAQAAEDALEEEVLKDLAALGQTEEAFQFFLAFAYEILDRYGRFLCFINRYQPDPDVPQPRPSDYNGRLLMAGKVSPYFIWPNVDPFRTKESWIQAVPPAGKAADWAEEDPALRAARQWVRSAREAQIGLYDRNNPLRLQPFEVRFLSRRRPPDRWVIDLGENSDRLIAPQDYYRLVNVEDRLFIPEEFVPLFLDAGWKKEGDS
jgi:hypothetical protein